jgi:hypothetical protein
MSSWLRFIPIFSLAFMVGYQVDDYLNAPLIKYYPNLGRFSVGWVSVPGGHNTIGWFGWICWGLITAIVVTALYALIPRRATDKITWNWAWVVPVCMAIFAFYIVVTNWWLHSPV